MYAPDALAAGHFSGASHPLGPAPYVDSDVGRLRTVLLHRPGPELDAVEAAANAPDLLFSEPTDLERAQAEHDAFAALLRTRGVEVLYVQDLLTEALEAAATREAVLAEALADATPAARDAVGEQPAPAAARALVEGVPGRLEPLPNLMFTRDQSAWLHTGVVRCPMATPQRRREARLLSALYRSHPRFGAAPCWSDAAPQPPRVEGGDLLPLGGGRVVVGVSERTPRSGARALATALLSAGAAREVLLLTVPPGAGFHLDLILTMVDVDTFALWTPAARALRGQLWRAGPTGIVGTPHADPLGWLSRAARLVPLDGPAGPHGRAWDHGTNVLAVEPGVVVAYEDNHHANRRLAAAGVEVIEVAGRALAAGRGGPHCLSCPVRRDPAPAGTPVEGQPAAAPLI